MYGGHSNGYISSFLTRRHNPRGQFEDTKDEEIDLWEDVDEKEDVVGVEEFDVINKEETIDIKDNLITTDEARDNEYTFEQCDYTTNIIESQTQHIKSKHQGLSTVKCDNMKNLPDLMENEKISVTNDVNTRNDFQGTELGVLEDIDYLEHIQSYSGEMYSCDQCDFNTGTTKLLYRHKRMKHEDASFECDECDHIGSQQCHVSYHKKGIPQGGTYICDKCDFSTNFRGNLNIHKKRKHEGVTYNCDQCDYRSNHSSNLIKYKKSKHEGVMYNCDQ